MAAVDFQLEACPHCGSEAEVREHAVYRYQCKACGTPRIPTNRRWITTPQPVTRHLKSVRSHHIQRGLWLAASWALWLVTTLCALFGAGTAWSLEFGLPGWTFVTVLTLLPLVLGVVARVAAASQKRQTVSRLDDAWREMASHFFTSAAGQGHGARTLGDVKAAFRVDNDVALRLLAEGEVAAFLDHEAVANTSAAASAAHARVRVVDETADLSEGAETFEDQERAASDLGSRKSHTK